MNDSNIPAYSYTELERNARSLRRRYLVEQALRIANAFEITVVRQLRRVRNMLASMPSNGLHQIDHAEMKSIKQEIR